MKPHCGILVGIFQTFDDTCAGLVACSKNVHIIQKDIVYVIRYSERSAHYLEK